MKFIIEIAFKIGGKLVEYFTSVFRVQNEKNVIATTPFSLTTEEMGKRATSFLVDKDTSNPLTDTRN